MPYIATSGEKVYDYEQIFALDMGDNVEDEEQYNVEFQKNEVIENKFSVIYYITLDTIR
jgi:hypothetical protein